MRTVTGTLGRNVAVQIAGRAGGAVLGLALAAVLTRTLSLDAYGSLSTALAALGLIAVAHEFGFVPIASRIIARDPDEAGPLLGTIVGLRLGVSLPLALLGAVALLAAGESRTFVLWAFGAFALVLAGRAVESVDVALHVAQRMGRSVIASLAGRTGALLAATGLATSGVRRAGPFLVAVVLGTAVSAILRVRLARPWCRLSVRREDRRLTSFLRQVAPTGIAALLMAGYMHADALIVRGIAGADEAALYNAPYRLFVLGASLAGLVMVSAAPVLSARWTEDRPGFRRGVVKLLGLSMLLAAPVAIGVAVLARPLLGLLFGPDYEVAAGTLGWLAFAAAAAATGTVATSALISCDRAVWTARLAALALVTNVGLDLALVPGMGGKGAAVATLITEGVVVLGAVAVLIPTLRRDR